MVDLSPFHGYTDNDSCCATNAPSSTIFRSRQEERGESRYTRSGSTHTSGNCTPHTHTSNHSSFSCGVKLRNIPIRLFTIQHLHWTGKQSPAFQCLIFRISLYVFTHTVVTHSTLPCPDRLVRILCKDENREFHHKSFSANLHIPSLIVTCI